MYLCVKGIDFASVYDFDIWFWIVLTMWFSFLLKVISIVH